MKIVQPHKTKSQAVSSYEQIAEEATTLRQFTNSGNFHGFYKNCHALHHSQVSEQPLNYFTLSKASEGLFGEWLIINPEIVSVDENKAYSVKEGCMSWPFRNLKRVERFWNIQVRYQREKKGKLEWVEKSLDGMAAQIFQHEYDHGRGVMIHAS